MFLGATPQASSNPLLKTPFIGNSFSRTERITKIADWIHPDDQNANSSTDFVKKTKRAVLPKHHVPKYTAVDRKKEEKKIGMRKRQERPVAVVRVASIEVKDDWNMISEIPAVTIEAVKHSADENPVDLAFRGKLKYFDRNLEKVTTKLPKALSVPQVQLPTTESISKDAYIQELASQPSDKTRIFATDTILASIMACTRAIYSWDVVITKKGKNIFLDKRPDSSIDVLTVNENSVEPPAENEKDVVNINSVSSLAAECTGVDAAYSKLGKKDAEEAVFANGASSEVLYRYRQWNISDQIVLIVRCQIDVAVHQPGTTGSSESIQPESSTHSVKETLLANIHSLFEYDSKNYRQKLDTQRGSLLALEIKNNAYKLQKWSIRAILSGVDVVKIGFISRVSVKETGKYVILASESWKKHEFLRKMGYDIENSWGILKALGDLIVQQPGEDDRYVLVKDPNRLVLRFYSVPYDSVSL